MIGVFDSGFGGLTVLKGLTDNLPRYDYLYLGDSARSPYGNKSDEAIYSYTKEAVDFLAARGCRLIILACNTASAKALRKIQQEHLPHMQQPCLRVLGVTIPICEAALEIKRTKRVGVIGTKATVNSKVFVAELHKIEPELEVFQKACPLLVPLIEEGWINRPEAGRILKTYLRPLKERRVDSLILGCTHYPLMIDKVRRFMGRRTRIVDSTVAVAIKLEDYLKRHPEIEQALDRNGKRIFLTTDNPTTFKASANQLFKAKLVDHAKKIAL